jgi:prepilin-type N-terminal cleavage/methylation domain-containing protein
MVRRSRGFTLIELMIVVAIVAVLAVVAIPKFLEWIKRGKSTEVGLQLNRIGKAALRLDLENGTFPTENGATLPAGGGAGNNCCGGKGGMNGVPGPTVINKCTGDAAAFTDGAGWQRLEFSVDEAGYYQYTFTGNATAPKATGQGDVDCDGTSATYTLQLGKMAGKGEPYVNIVGPPPGVY